MEAIPRATPRAHINPEQPVVTRHGLRSPHVATPSLRRMRQYTRFAKISATALNISRGQLLIHGPPGDKFHSPNPHRPSPQPRGVRAWEVFVRLTASENLHHAGHPRGRCFAFKADTRITVSSRQAMIALSRGLQRIRTETMPLSRQPRFRANYKCKDEPRFGRLRCGHFLDWRRLPAAVEDRGWRLLWPIKPQHGNKFAALCRG
jgi:hypothetical protein